jgi:hypothetical protein
MEAAGDFAQGQLRRRRSARALRIFIGDDFSAEKPRSGEESGRRLSASGRNSITCAGPTPNDSLVGRIGAAD